MPVLEYSLRTFGIVILAVGLLLLGIGSYRDGTLLHIYSNISWLKILYTAIILSIACLFLFEAHRVWFDDQIRLGTFRYYDAAAEQANRGKELVLRIAGHHSRLRRQFAESQPSDDECGESLQLAIQPIKRPQQVLQDIDITVQEVNVSAILRRLQSWFSSPKEITGMVFNVSNHFDITLQFPESGYTLKDGSTVASAMYFSDLKDLDEAAFEAACGIIWLDAARAQADIARINYQEFCTWTRHWSRYLRLARRYAFSGELTDSEIQQVESLRTSISKAIEAGATYAKFWELRADLVGLLPAERRAELRKEKQNDELVYLAKVLADTKGQASGETLYRALALARPALCVQKGELALSREVEKGSEQISKLWGCVFKLDESKEAVKRAAKATGLFRIVRKDDSEALQQLWQLGFAIGEGLIATASYSIIGKLHATESNQLITIPDSFTAEFVFADSPPQEGDTGIRRHKVKRIFHLGKLGISGLSLLEIEGHNCDAFPPLNINLNAVEGLDEKDFICIIGYPAFNSRLPKEFLTVLFGDKKNRCKRAMPGRVISLPPTNAAEQFSASGENAIIVDASTTGGTGGGPLIDLASGELVGVHFAGSWQDIGQGKFGYSAPLQWLFPGDRLRNFLNAPSATLTMDSIVAQVPDVNTRDEQTIIAELTPAGHIEKKLSKNEPECSLSAAGYQMDFLSTTISLPQVMRGAKQASEPLHYTHFSIVMNTHQDRRIAFFTAENIDGTSLLPVRKNIEWRVDPRLDQTMQTDYNLYRMNILDRGHLVRRKNVAWGNEDEAQCAGSATQYYTNATPQLKTFNQSTWLLLEDALLSYITEHETRASIFSGPVFEEADPMYRTIKIPQAYWKIMIAIENERPRVAGYMLRQRAAVAEEDLSGDAVPFDFVNSRIKITEIEKITGIDFGPLRNFEELKF